MVGVGRRKKKVSSVKIAIAKCKSVSLNENFNFRLLFIVKIIHSGNINNIKSFYNRTTTTVDIFVFPPGNLLSIRYNNIK